MSKTVIVGGGIAGLATAFYLQQCGDIRLHPHRDALPAGAEKLPPPVQDGFLVEGGPDSFITQKAAAMRSLHTGSVWAISSSAPSTGKQATTYVWSRGRLHPIPEGMMLMAPTMVLPFLRSRLISWPGKLRMGMEVLVPQQHQRSRTKASPAFVRRRLGSRSPQQDRRPADGRHPRRRSGKTQPPQHLPHVSGDGEESTAACFAA